MVAGRLPFGRRGVDRARNAAVVPERLASLGPARASAVSAALALSRAGRPSMTELVLALRVGETSTPRPAPAAAAIATLEPMARAPVAPPAATPAAVAAAPRSRLTLRVGCAAGLALFLGIVIGRFGGEADPVLAPAPVPQQAPEIQSEPEPPVPSAAIAAPAPASATPQESATGPAQIAPPPPAGPTGLVFFDVPRMVVSRRAVVAPVPLRHLSHSRRAVSVHWRAIDGSARSGRDYGGPQSGVEHFVEGNSFRMLYVPLVPSPTARRDRSFTIELTEASAGTELSPTSRVEITILGES
jgi:hypothetical protein